MSETLAGLPSGDLLARVRKLVQAGNAVEADLVAHLGEVDARGLYLEEGCSSMFVYCQRVLHFAEGVAYKRIQAARAARRHPEVLEALRSGELHLTAVGLLAPKLTAGNCAELIRAGRHRSADEVKRLLADREPKPAAPTFVRQIATLSTSAIPLAAPSQAPIPQELPTFCQQPARSAPLRDPTPQKGRTEPLGGERFRVQFTADGETYAQLEELRALMRHQIPDGDIGKVLARAISSLLNEVRKRKFAETRAPRTPRSPNEAPSRHIPAAVRRAVSKRDGGRCTFTSSSGSRCDSREFLEFDHAKAWTWSKTHSIEGITLRCRAHNQLRARIDFGKTHMARFHRPKLESPGASAPDPNRGATGFESSWRLPWSSVGQTAESP